MIRNHKNYQTKLSVQRLDTHNKNKWYLPIVNLSCFQRGVSYCAMTNFNSLPNNIKNLRNDTVKFKTELRKYPNTHSSYSLTEFFENNKSNIHNSCSNLLTCLYID
jgi:hypothetical protein